jgi:hypothetical protein
VRRLKGGKRGISPAGVKQALAMDYNKPQALEYHFEGSWLWSVGAKRLS